MNIEIEERCIKLSKNNVVVRMDFVTEIDKSKIDWYISDLTRQLEIELALTQSNVDISKQINLPYGIKRQNEYPPIQEQLDMLYWDMINNTNQWKDKITEIKEKYPKVKLENN